MNHRRIIQGHAARCFAPFLAGALAILSGLPVAAAGPLIFSCSADNALFRVASENGMEVKRFNTLCADRVKRWP